MFHGLPTSRGHPALCIKVPSDISCVDQSYETDLSGSERYVPQPQKALTIRQSLKVYYSSRDEVFSGSGFANAMALFCGSDLPPARMHTGKSDSNWELVIKLFDLLMELCRLHS